MVNIILEIVCAISFLAIMLSLGIGFSKERFSKQHVWLVIVFIMILVAAVTRFMYVNTFKEGKFYLATQVILALLTLFVIIVSIWGEKIKAILIPMDFRLQYIEPKGDIVDYGEEGDQPHETVIYFHLEIKNFNPPSILQKCRVLLKAVRKIDEDGITILKEKILYVPYSFNWAVTYSQSDDFQRYKNVSHTAALDFVKVNIKTKKITPVLIDYFPGHSNFFDSEFSDMLELDLLIEGDNYTLDRIQTFRVRWNGNWNDPLEKIAKEIIIEEMIRK